MSTALVYTGRWTDWTKGAVLGDQITISAAHSNVLIAFIAIFITFVGGVTWSIIAYIIHQLRVSRKFQDALHYQLQALLRNKDSPTSFAYHLFVAGFAWRKHTKFSKIAKSFRFAMLALVVYATFAAAGLLLSILAQTGNVLLVGTGCGATNTSSLAEASPAIQTEWALADSVWGNQEVVQAYNYAQTCYPSNLNFLQNTSNYIAQAPDSNCDFFVKSSLNWTTSYPGQCPFKPGVCRGPTSDIVRLDTGYLDTHNDLGRNAKKEDRLLFRRVTTCAPLITEGFSTNTFVNNSVYGNVAIYKYGPNPNQPVLTYQNLNWANQTFVYPHSDMTSKLIPYEILFASTDEYFVQGNESFVPDPKVAAPGTSVTLLFLANRAYYSEPVLDPWFSASSIFPESNPLAEGQDWYYNEKPGSVLGCVNEVEICNPNLPNNSCMTWPYQDILNYAWSLSNGSLEALQLNDHQTQLSQYVASALYDSAYFNIIGTTNTNPLLASNYLYQAGSIVALGLPPNQWVAELQNLQAVSMALIQRTIYTFASGPSSKILQEYMSYADRNSWACSNQKFNNDAYVTFSVLGLSLIFGIGGLIAILGTVITFIVPSFQKKTGRGEYRRRQWYANEVLHLQRLAFEDRELGSWKGEVDDLQRVPVTNHDDKFPTYTGIAMAPIRRCSDTATSTAHKGDLAHGASGTDVSVAADASGQNLNPADTEYSQLIIR